MVLIFEFVGWFISYFQLFYLVGSLNRGSTVSNRVSDLKISEYEFLKEMPKEAWAWEFTRRSPIYISAWKNHLITKQNDLQITTSEMTKASKFGLLFFIDPLKNSEQVNVFWAPEKIPNVLKCSLILHNHNECRERLILADLKLKLTYVQSDDGLHHLLLKDKSSSLQLLFDMDLDLNTFFDFEIHLPAFCNRTKQLRSAIKLDELLSYRKFEKFMGLSASKSYQYAQILFAHDLLQLGQSQREVARILFGEDAILDNWDGLSDYSRTKMRRIIARGRLLIKAGYSTFF